MNFQAELTKRLSASFGRDGSFNAEKFCKQWFEHSRAYFFLFKKNLSVTNIQLAELVALLRDHVAGGDGVDFHFRTKDEFLTGVAEVVGSLQTAEPADGDSVVDTLVKLYARSIEPVILVERLYGSCSVWLPPHLAEIHLDRICHESGYIHSAGRLVLAENMDTMNAEYLAKGIVDHVTRRNLQSPTVPSGPDGEPAEKVEWWFRVYCHEDFSPFDRDQAEELRGGLEDVKIFRDKFFVGHESLGDIVADTESAFSDAKLGKLNMFEGDYTGDPQAVARGEGDEPNINRTLWLIVDRNVDQQMAHLPGGQQYLICYEQCFLNANPLHIFDENKPAWVDHTTLPHTLAGAMLNITRPWAKEATISDPFSGTGTIWLEAMKFDRINVQCTDKALIAGLLAHHNAEFFSLDSDALKEIATFLCELGDLRRLPAPEKHDHWKTDGEKTYEAAFKVISKANDKKWEIEDDLELISELKGCERLCWVLFYAMLRTHKRHNVSLARWEAGRGGKAWTTALLEETKVLCSQIRRLQERREKEEIKGAAIEGEIPSLLTYSDTYSECCTIASTRFQYLREAGRSSTIAVDKDAQRFGDDDVPVPEDERVDVIVCDPPYGVNAPKKFSELARLYTMALRGMIRRLKNNGQLVICLAKRSRIGRRIPAFITKGWVMQQILAEARKMGRDVVIKTQVIPEAWQLHGRPYYWESERGLSRSILHVHFQDRVQ